MKLKLLQTTILCGIIIACSCLLTVPSHAGGDPGLNGYNYAINTKTTNVPQIYWSHIAVNKTNLADSFSYAVTRQKTFSGTTIVSGEINALTYKCGVSTEVSFAKSVAVNTTAQFSIPANSSVTCRYGSAMLRTTGDMERWSYGKLMSSKGVTEKYSYSSYSDKYYN